MRNVNREIQEIIKRYVVTNFMIICFESITKGATDHSERSFESRSLN
jgi:hypothetical protein